MNTIRGTIDDWKKQEAKTREKYKTINPEVKNVRIEKKEQRYSANLLVINDIEIGISAEIPWSWFSYSDIEVKWIKDSLYSLIKIKRYDSEKYSILIKQQLKRNFIPQMMPLHFDIERALKKMGEWYPMRREKKKGEEND